MVDPCHHYILIIIDTYVYSLINYNYGRGLTVRVIVLGGAGAMGAMAARFIADVPGVTAVTVADRRLDGATAAAQDLATRATPAQPLAVDVNEPAQLAAAIADHDIVVNAVGPFYTFGVPILSAVIAAGRHYVDICDDWEPTIEMLALDDAAKASGSVCVVGAGASPGASNLLALLAACELDEIDDVFTVWPVDVGNDDEEDVADALTPGDGAPSAAAVHWMQQISGTIRVFADGQFVDVAPLQPIPMTFPGIGSGTAYTVGHPEPITLAGSLRVRRRSANAMLITSATLAFLEGLQRDLDSGKLTNETAAIEVHNPSIRRQAKAAVGALRRQGPGDLPPFFAVASGTKNGVATRSGAMVLAFPAGMAAATAAPAAIVVRQLVEGTINTPGVHPPERVVDPDAFFSAMRAYCAGAALDESIVQVAAEPVPS
jgi:lysine 6-dehydrogenase